MKIKKRKKNDRRNFFRGTGKYSRLRLERPQSTGNEFRDAMLKNRGISTNQ